MSALRNAARLVRDPALAAEYVGWTLSSLRTGGKPVRRLLGGIIVGGFTNFSEYHSVPRFINEQERSFFETTPVGEGAIVDVGANIGLVSLLLARRFRKRAIHAFEPNPSTFAALQANVARNAAANITCHRAAVADVEGTLMFDNDPVKRGTASIAIATSRHVEEVPAITLDSFVAAQAIERIGFLKIDVEGFETLVLRGAAQVLREVRPAVIYFEMCPALTTRSGFDAADPARILIEAGYTLTRLDGAGDPSPAGLADVALIDNLENWVAVPA